MKKILLFLYLSSIQFSYSQCNEPSVFDKLDIGNVHALITNGGDFWFDGIVSVYNTPQFDPNTGVLDKRIMFVGGLWLSAKDNSGNLKVAAMSYRNQGFEFYPGPIDNITGTIDYQTCNFYNQIWEVLDSEVQDHIVMANNNTPVPVSLISPNVLNWPAKGNDHISLVTITDELAPFVDVNSNGTYEPEYGDYPKIHGDQALFWVMNDIGGPHEVYGGDPLEVQVQMLAYAYKSGLLLNTTIYECKVINKSFGHLNDFRFGLFMDPDIPPSTANYVGCDTVRNTSFAYKGSTTSSNNPVSSVTFLNQEMNSFNYMYNSGPVSLSDPIDDIGLDNYLHAKDTEGNPFSLWGIAGPMPISFMVPGNPSNSSEWSMNSSNTLVPSDYRTVQVTGPHPINAWTSFDVSWAVHTSFPPNYNTNTFYTEVAAEIDSIQFLFDNFDDTYDYSELTSLKNSTLLDQQVSLYPNPSHGFIQLNYGKLKLQKAYLYGLDGKLIKKQVSEMIDVRDLSSGLYLLKLDFEEGSTMKKIVKQ